MFSVKKFVAFIAFNDYFRELYFDKVEALQLDSRWDTYHVLEDKEAVPVKEVEIMKTIYHQSIEKSLNYNAMFESSINDFQNNLRKKLNS